MNAEAVSILTEMLCEASWEGAWRPLDETNVRPLAAHTASVLVEALHRHGYIIEWAHNDAPDSPVEGSHIVRNADA